MPVTRPRLRFAYGHPARFVALGLGIGLVPAAPGTIGTLAAVPLYLGLTRLLATEFFLALWCALFLVGIWACELTGRHLGAHDHRAMVWDEIVAFVLVLFFTPQHPLWQAIAFALFRVFDVLKPAPIRSVERALPNGLGVMLDDLIAAFYTLLCMAAWKLVFG
ncbi:MAG TPA: phosphatidylglycerophosphatase A [Burkholderiales bacterium]|nr:phosphatidylglycerophosphatase A [Burkholderiales bacterium]